MDQLIGKPIFTVSVRQYSQEKISLSNGHTGYQYTYHGYISEYKIQGVLKVDQNTIYSLTGSVEKVEIFKDFNYIIFVNTGFGLIWVGLREDGTMYSPEITLAGKPKEFFMNESEAKKNQKIVCERVQNVYKNVKEIVYR